MTDRVFGLHVLLDQDYREDDVQVIIDAIEMIKHVKHVDIYISTPDTWMAKTHAKRDLAKRLLEIVDELYNTRG